MNIINFIISKIRPINILCFLFALIHFFVVLKYTPAYPETSEQYNKNAYFIIKSISFLLIFLFYQLIPYVIDIFKSNDSKKISFIKYFSLYFLLNILVLIITYPLFNRENSVIQTLHSAGLYYIATHPNLLQSASIVIAYHIIPTIAGISVVFSFFYSLIFAYCISGLKERFKTKIFYIVVIPFVIPFVLTLNQQPVRLISGSWILMFIMLFILYNRNKCMNNIFKLVIFAVITAFAAKYRSEYIVIALFIPLMIYFYKIFNKRNLFIFLVVLISFFGIYKLIDPTLHYELHNLSFVYDEYILNNYYDKDIEKNNLILHKVYRQSFLISELPSASDDFDFRDKKENEIVVNCLIKFALKHSLMFIKSHYDSIVKSNDYFQILCQKNILYDSQRAGFYVPECLLKDYPVKQKITSYLLYFNKNADFNKFLNIVHPQFIIIALFLMLIFGIITKKHFYTFLFFIFGSILYLELLFMYFSVTLYFWACFHNISVFLFILISEVIDTILSGNHPKISKNSLSSL